jgi:hypothetical protein
MRPQTSSITKKNKNNILIRKSQSKDLTSKLNFKEFINTKSTSPIKKRELYETPVKVDKPKIKLKFIPVDKKETVQPKIFEAIDILPIGFGSDRRHYRSSTKI